jgi:hypothetical protein
LLRIEVGNLCPVLTAIPLSRLPAGKPSTLD